MMGKALIKPEREKDFYIVWSSVVDAPVAFASKASIQEADPTWTDDYFERADRLSSSSRIFPETWDEDFTMNFQNSGTIRRSQMVELCKRLNEIWDDLYSWYKDPQVQALLTPFEEDDDDDSDEG
jgi:hypothetical protein